MDGYLSDLRTGLPWQMVEIHEPVRSLFIIETTPEAMLRIMERNEGIRRLCVHGWVTLALVDPQTQAISVFRDGAFQPYRPQSAGAAAGRVVGRLVSRLARPPGIRRDRAVIPRSRGDVAMSPAPHWLTFLGLVVVAAPFLLTVMLGISSLLDRRPSERTMVRWVQTAVVSGLLAAVVVLIAMLALGTRHVAIDLGNWVAIPRHYHFSVKFVFDRLSVPMAILSFTLSGTIGAFASKYLHRERGFHRFFVLYALFLLGMVVASLAGTIETLFTGWELVGLSSALLVAYFQERPAPARNGLWVWVVYRFSDAALLLAAVAMHHLRGEGDFDQILGTDPWPMGHATLTSHQAFVVGLLMLVAAAGKSALVPFSGWLPRAMEGPTPSSAVFYGALSVHLGAFLLLRISPILDASPCSAGDRRGAGAGHRRLRLPGRQRADGHQVGAGLRLADPGGDHRRRDRPGLPLRRPDPPAGPRLPADAPVPPGADAPARLPHAGERHRRPSAGGPAALGPPGDPARRGLDVPAGPRAGLPRQHPPRIRGPAVRPDLPVVRPAGAAMDRLPLGRRIARVGPGQAPFRND